MIPDQDADCVYLSDLLPSRHPDLTYDLLASLEGSSIGVRWIAGTRDIWCRDYMPIQIGEGRFVQFTYRPDYLRGYEHLITPPEVAKAIPYIKECIHSDFVLDGGNVVGWGDCAIITDKVYRENAGWRPLELRRELGRLLEVEKVAVIPREPHDPFGHADGIVRFIGDRAVLVNEYSAAPAYRARLHAALRRVGLKLQEMPYRPVEDSTGGIPSAVGNYVNFLRVGRTVVVPAYGRKEDEAALRLLQSALPGCCVIPLTCRALAAQGGGLNCVSWTIRIDSRGAQDRAAGPSS
jgi:agmatine deiminase